MKNYCHRWRNGKAEHTVMHGSDIYCAIGLWKKWHNLSNRQWTTRFIVDRLHYRQISLKHFEKKTINWFLAVPFVVPTFVSFFELTFWKQEPIWQKLSDGVTYWHNQLRFVHGYLKNDTFDTRIFTYLCTPASGLVIVTLYIGKTIDEPGPAFRSSAIKTSSAKWATFSLSFLSCPP
jgi:hypothetical protein